ncbi:DUF411 domain-containing protein [Novosphingobium profundi]|jgi:hypothetical protein|uniref:DUF411 domain-containing protein n=1 Tax=Sphingomonadales TaxID=204457 RepID=UPI0003D682F3|nr:MULTISPECIES: DUF411 domain-containing protein [Sphingomonadaceae]ETI60510.1 metal-binding protein [Sphingobium sp. C100]MBT0671707.1 DUF411 domain-containing protein [Novosphingobium profundi]
MPRVNRFKPAMASALLLALGACSNAAQATEYTMYRDPSCGCCEQWAEHVRHGMNAQVIVKDSADMATVKDDNAVPADLRSCHTMEVSGYVIEGHVPAADIQRLLKERPAGVRGLAVAGMPLGSPGMEMGDQAQPYQVVAFGEAGRSVFNSYN